MDPVGSRVRPSLDLGRGLEGRVDLREGLGMDQGQDWDRDQDEAGREVHQDCLHLLYL